MAGISRARLGDRHGLTERGQNAGAALLGQPPDLGDGVLDQLEVLAAPVPGHYMAGPYAALLLDGQRGDAQTSIGYGAVTGEVWVEPPAGVELTSINLDSAAGVFTGDPAMNLGGSFDNDTNDNIFKAMFGGSFGNAAQMGLSEEFLLSDLPAVGSLAGGGPLGDVDLIYVPVPEPSALVLAVSGSLAVLLGERKKLGW